MDDVDGPPQLQRVVVRYLNGDQWADEGDGFGVSYDRDLGLATVLASLQEREEGRRQVRGIFNLDAIASITIEHGGIDIPDAPPE